MSLKRNVRGAGPSSAQQSGVAGAGALDCTTECRVKEHALVVLCSAFLGNLKLLKHCASVCANPLHIQDSLGRNALHVAASKGHLQLVRWLVARRKVKVDVSDLESSWTALHRSAFYGQLGTVALLVKYGADLKLLDNEGWSPLDILNADRECIKPTLTIDAINVYTWGRNPNVTLGHDRTKKYPEKLDVTLAPTDFIVKVVLCKFHSVFLSRDGSVLSCGHGLGGRLGHDTEQSIVTPRVVKTMEGLVCVGVAAARDHTVILTKGGGVYTCGLNDAHQLGHGSNPTTAPTNYLAPKLVRGLKNKHIIAVGAGRYHTAMCTETELYTVGKNLGQLGYEKIHETQVAPRAVAINLDSDIIIQLSVSDSATAVLTKKHLAFVCTGFTVKRVRLGFLDKVNCLQFEVCASLSDRDYLRKVETEPTKLLVLDSEHKLWVWEPTRRGSYPNTIQGFAKHNVTQFSLGKSLTVVTREGEVYKGNASVNKPLNLQRVPGIQNARAVFTDFKANNFAYIQSVYGSPFLPLLSPSTLSLDVSSLLEDALFPGSVSDMTIEVANQNFDVHKYILASQARDFMSQLVPCDSPVPSTFRLRKKCDNPDVFEAFLHYVYGCSLRLVPPPSSAHAHPPSPLATTVENTPDTSFTSVDENDLTEEYDNYYNSSDQPQEEWIEIEAPIFVGQSTPRKRSHSSSAKSNSAVEDLAESLAEPEKVLQLGNRRADMKSLLQLAMTFDLIVLKKSLEEAMPDRCKTRTLARPKLKLRRQQELSDLTLVSKEGKAIHCHRCVLVARSEYFRSMLLMGWKESSDDLTSLTMPVCHKVLKAVIDFIYTDEIQITGGADVIEWLMAVLTLADQLLLTRLKELCEYALAKILDLKNAVEFLEFAEAYSALQLKKACLQFICVNCSHFLEARYLDGVDLALLDALSQEYHELILPNSKRVIKFPEPSLEQLPESYFQDPEEDGVDSGAGESEEEDCRSTPTPELPDTSVHTPSSTISPRALSNSRRKRKRKTSQSEKKQSRASKSPPPLSPMEEKSLSPPSISPTEEKSIMFRANPCPANPASPDSITSPCSPVSALSSADWHPRPPASTPSRSNQHDSQTTTSTTSPWVSIEKKRRNSNTLGGKTPRDSITIGEVVVLRSQSVPATSPHAVDTAIITPPSAPDKTAAKRKIKSETRTRLMNKFNALTSETETPGPENITAYGRQKSVPSVPWGGLVTGSKDLSSLRDIMAKEQEIQQKTKQLSKSRSSPPPLGQNDPGAENRPSQAQNLTRSQPIPMRSIQRESSMPSPSTVSPSPASSNPWKTPGSCSPAVSMRALIAQAEAEDKHSKLQAQTSRQAKRTQRKTEEEKPARRQLAIQPHQQVSFASIIKSQESERDRNRPPQKALSLIQIEERAISELEKAYCALDNPDEVIVVERYSKNCQQTNLGRPSGPSNSPWTL